MTWREWVHWSYGKEYQRQLESNNYRMLYVLQMNINRGKNKPAFKAEQVWPLPFIDPPKPKVKNTKEHDKLRDFYKRYNTALNGN